MQATGDFFKWWYEAWGIGGWAIFFLLAVAAIAWLIYDSQTRGVGAIGWRMGAILPALLLLPSAILGFSPTTRVQMQDLLELFFYLGLIGGIVPVIVAVGYYITYKDTRGCEKGHIYDASLSECPICAQQQRQPVRLGISQQQQAGVRQHSRPEPEPDRSPSRPTKPAVNAWLVDEGANRTYQLFQGDSRIGRSKQVNDIVLGDKAISREHLLIREERGHFTIYDRGAKTGTYVNGRRVESPLLLAHDDVIEIGDTQLRFITSRR
jgi:hypothetical protein